VAGAGSPDRPQPRRLVHDQLDLRDEALDLHVGHRAPEPVASAQMPTVRIAPQAVDLAGRDDAAIAAVAGGLDPSRAIPAPQRVEADPQRLGRLARGGELLRHRQLGYRSRVFETRSIESASGKAAPIRRPPTVAERTLRCCASFAAARAARLCD